MKLSHCVLAFALATTCLLTGIAKSQVSVTPGQTRAAQSQVDAADTIYTGGEIVTVNDKQPSAEALAVKGGKIVAVGRRADVEKAHKGVNTMVVDLGGKALLPGFLDAHSHYISSLTVANQVNLYAPPAGPGKDPASIVAALVKYRDTNKIPAKSSKPMATTRTSCRTGVCSTATTSTRHSPTIQCWSGTSPCTARY
jgi:hypothetical protein